MVCLDHIAITSAQHEFKLYLYGNFNASHVPGEARDIEC